MQDSIVWVWHTLFQWSCSDGFSGCLELFPLQAVLQYASPYVYPCAGILEPRLLEMRLFATLYVHLKI